MNYENIEDNIEWVHCNRCLRSTRHEVVARRDLTEIEYDEGVPQFEFLTTYTMLECRGCGAVTLRERFNPIGHDYEEISFYPPPISRRLPRWGQELPDDFQSLLKETYNALYANSKRLALMGARTLVDLFMNKTIGDIGGFQAKLKRLEEGGYLSSKNRAILEPALDAGHAATHRGHEPNSEDVNLVFDIVENLIQTLVLENKVEQLKKNTPKRQNHGKP